MVIDTSALAAIGFDDPDSAALIHKIAHAPSRLISSATLLEASIVIEARRGEIGGRELDLFLHRANVQAVAVDEHQINAARSAWRRYGKGRHAAGLNFGDLFSYALASTSGEPLLFKGNDFARTDIEQA